MRRAEYDELLQALGHFRIAVVRKTAGGFYVECECGYRSTHRAVLREAVQTAEHHRAKMVKEWRSTGVSLPRSSAAGL